MLLDILAGIAGLADSMVWIAAPWRFLFSKQYRQRKQVEWSSRPAYISALQQFGGFVSFALQLSLLALASAVILHAYRSA